MKAQYKERLLVISPFSAMLLILAISQMVMSIIAANVAKETTQYSHVTFTPTNIKIHIAKQIIPAPANRPIATIANPLSLDLDSKAMRAIKPNIKDVMPNVIPKRYQGTNMVIVDSITPIRTV